MDLFEAAGWIVDKVEKQGRFGASKTKHFLTGKEIKSRDLFGFFDLIAIRVNPSSGMTEIRLVQVTCNKPHTHKDYHDFAKTYVLNHGMGLDRLTVWQYVWMDRKGWKTFKYLGTEEKKYEIETHFLK